MSDYIYSSIPQPKSFLENQIKRIYKESAPQVFEYHGDWGSLAVSKQHYHGFRVLENENHLFIVIGGPVLCFQKNDFLVEPDSNTGTNAIYQRWLVDKEIRWDEDLSGPFTLLLIDKQVKSLTVITDLMAFIPVYYKQKAEGLFLGTHIDALARVAGEADNLDQVSLADFVLNNVVTFPYTTYENVYQLDPGSIIKFEGQGRSEKSYWLPTERNPYKNLEGASLSLREGIIGYINQITSSMTEVAQFISAGEDSRSLSGMLPQHLKRDAYIFLDHMNREGRIAKEVAEIYGTKFTVGYRGQNHYLDILPEASILVGMGHQYTHAHSIGFDKQYNLSRYPAVFGGYLSDSLLKAAYTRKTSVQGRFPFVPEIFIKGENRTKAIKKDYINSEVLTELNERRKKRFENVQKIRPDSAHEWFVLWPATMRATIPNVYTTRRLFRSYEPFMCKEAVKISAAVPTQWKLNRKLFNQAMKPYLKPSKWLLHADGRLPYFSWWVNMPIQFPIWFYRHVAKRIGLIKGNQGPWGDWRNVLRGESWRRMVEEYSVNAERLGFLEDDANLQSLLLTERMTIEQKINLIQILFDPDSLPHNSKRTLS